MNRLFPLTVCVLLLPWGIEAQAQKNFVVKKAAKSLSAKTTPTARAKTQQAIRQMASSLTRYAAAARQETLHNHAQRSLFILESDTNTAPATGFVIEERFNGQSFLWGVTAAHLIDAYEAPFMMFMIDGQPIGLDAVTVVKGHREGADIALLLLPPQAADVVKPLSVAPELPQTGENAFSMGYAAGVFKLAENRTILEVNPFRLVTSYELRHAPRRGYCGSPLFNAQNEVIGVHCGSNLKDQISPAWRTDLKRLKINIPDVSLAVPIGRVHDLLAWFRAKRPHGIEMKANNISVGTLLPHQHILQVAVLKDKYLGQSINGGPYIDPSHLERFFNLNDADGLLITVYDPAEQNKQIIDYIVNFNTQSVKKRTRPLSGKAPFTYRARKTR